MPKNSRGFHEYNETEPVAATASGMLNKQTEALTARDTPQVVNLTTIATSAIQARKRWRKACMSGIKAGRPEDQSGQGEFYANAGLEN